MIYIYCKKECIHLIYIKDRFQLNYFQVNLKKCHIHIR